MVIFDVHVVKLGVGAFNGSSSLFPFPTGLFAAINWRGQKTDR